MGEDLNEMVYMMAAEKVVNLLFTIEHTLDFLEEHKVKPDEEVKKALTPALERIKIWVKT